MGQNILYLVPFAMIDHRDTTIEKMTSAIVAPVMFIVLMMGALFVPSFAVAQSGVQNGGIFDVIGVEVDVTAASTNAARDKARVLGERKAFRDLLERLTMRVDHSRLPELSSSEIAPYIRDFEVAREKASSVRYLATLNYHFKAHRIRDLLIELAIPFAETASKPVLVLPVYQAAGAQLLWDDPNPWRDSWESQPDMYSLVPTILPQGDLADIAAIGAEQAAAGDMQRLAVISARYQTGSTIVAHAIMKMDRGKPDLEVYVTRYGNENVEQSVIKNFISGEGETLDLFLSRAASELKQQIEDNWKYDNLLQFGNRAVVAVTIRISGLEDWLQVRKRLANVAVVRSSDLVILSLDEVRVNLNYIGSPQQLSLALQQADLKLFQEGDGWILELVTDGGKH